MEEYFLRLNTLLLYDHISLTFGPELLTPGPGNFTNLSRGRHGHEYNAFSFFSNMCGRREEVFINVAFFHIFGPTYGMTVVIEV